MNPELSFGALLTWAVVIQIAILALVVLLLVHRRSRQASMTDIQGRPASATRFRHRWLLAGGLMGAVLVAAGIYYVFLPEEQPWYEHYHPRTKPDTLMANPPHRTDTDHVSSESSLPDRPHRDLRTREDGRAPRIRDAARRFLRGRNPAERKGFQPPDPVLHTYLSLINKWRMESRDDPQGQDLTADSVYDRLVTKFGFRGSRDTVSSYFGNAPYFIPEGCGQAAEVDWITIPVVLDGRTVQIGCFFMASKWSHRYVIICCRCDNIASFLDAHMCAFDFFGGIFPTLAYRALSDLMAEELAAADNPWQEMFDRFCSDYQISPDFQKIEEGPELASRERRLRDLFSERVPAGAGFKDIEELNRALLERSGSGAQGGPGPGHQAEAMQKLYEQEKICLRPFTGTRFENVERITASVGPSGMLQIGETHYRVPETYAGRSVQAVFSPDRVDIFDGSDRIASYPRPCGKQGLTTPH